MSGAGAGRRAQCMPSTGHGAGLGPCCGRLAAACLPACAALLSWAAAGPCRAPWAARPHVPPGARLSPAARRRARGTRTLTRSSCASTRSSQRWLGARLAGRLLRLEQLCPAAATPRPRPPFHTAAAAGPPPPRRSRTSRRLSWGGLRWRPGTTRPSRQSTATAGWAPAWQPPQGRLEGRVGGSTWQQPLQSGVEGAGRRQGMLQAWRLARPCGRDCCRAQAWLEGPTALPIDRELPPTCQESPPRWASPSARPAPPFCN